FELDLGWTTTATASAGLWERGVPVGTTYNSRQCNPGEDVDSDNSDQCYVTGNAGGSAGADDVDDGTVTLTSPPMRLGQYADAVLSFWYWFFNDGGLDGNPNDNFSVQVSNGQQSATLFTTSESQSEWRFSGDIHLKDFLPLTNNMRVSFVTADQNPGHLVEAAVDVFRVTPGAVITFEPDPNAQLALTPNPTASEFLVTYRWPDVHSTVLEVRNLLGQTVYTRHLENEAGSIRLGNELPAGIYLVALYAEGRQSTVIKAVKQ
ncbi:MAG: T9SS type A sorting domain-containing protein, partial [Thermoanaerobaculia bacterium]|nr:T9SS type A sorting domain-containing protein [Thermoanaerobaculia bacterium]